MKYKNCLFLFSVSFLNLSLVFLPVARGTTLVDIEEKSLHSQLTSDNLLQQGKQLYDRGKLTAAARIWEQAKIYQSNQKLADLIRINNYLATVYQDLGEYDNGKKAIAENKQLISQAEKQIRRRNSSNFSLLYAQTLNTQGSWELHQGNGETAYNIWQETEKVYRSLDDATGIIISQINQAQALHTLGFYERSLNVLNTVQQQLNSFPNSRLKIATLHTLGKNLELSGSTKQAKKVLLQSLTLAKKLNSTNDIAQTLFQLGNVARTQNNNTEALDYYQKAISNNPHPQTLLKTRLNQFSLLIETEQTAAATKLLAPIQEQIAQLSLSRWGIYARVNFAQSLIKINNPEVEQFLIDTIEQATNLEDKIAQAHALGTLGNWYELNHSYDKALNLTDLALQLLIGKEQTTLAATLHWQSGRLLKAQGKPQKAIAAYQAAVNNLEQLQQELVSVNSDVRFSFQQQIEPIYRQLVALLLQDIDRLTPEKKQARLERSLLTIEALKQKELENFFRLACLDITEQNIAEIDNRAAVIYPILLPDSIEVIVSVPQKPLIHYRSAIASNTQSTTFKQLLQYLNPVFKATDIQPTAQKLYDWLIRPAETILQEQQIKTLVFVLDDDLRSLPMSVLHDREQHLIEKYDIALTPGLQLLRNNKLARSKGDILTGGITKPRQGFSALPGVAKEINNISDILSATVLIDRDFTNYKIKQKIALQPISILHLATHGQFSSNAEETFILTWENRINVNDFDRLLNQRQSNTPIDLLVLSACQTAAGDKRAILGLAGMAIRSGATSTLATLWSVSDRSTAQLMTQFYSYLQQPDINKAEAIRKAQLSLLKDTEYQHPYYWSGFVLVGNWQ